MQMPCLREQLLHSCDAVKDSILDCDRFILHKHTDDVNECCIKGDWVYQGYGAGSPNDILLKPLIRGADGQQPVRL